MAHKLLHVDNQLVTTLSAVPESKNVSGGTHAWLSLHACAILQKVE